ncbi:TfuA-like protein [Octadecabacter sp.]|nr:TfuA-like protein [Octadecabacter sp.]
MKIVFAGPSLWPALDKGQAPINVDAGIVLRPPAARGDILRALENGASQIGLIDGLFGDRPSISHKEILFALSRGCQVIGGASMGALRAAECKSYGMQGVGTIFADYVTGLRVSCSDVAVVHAPEHLQWRPLSMARIDVQATLDAATAIWPKGSINLLRHAAAATHFSKLTWEELTSSVSTCEQLTAWLHANTVHRKHLDAIAVLDVLAAPAPLQVGFEFEITKSLAADIDKHAPCLTVPKRITSA